MTLSIINAEYFSKCKSIDCTEKLRDMIVNDRLVVVADNNLAGDPDPGKRKKLRVRYVFNGREREKIVLERSRLKIGNEEVFKKITAESIEVSIPEKAEPLEPIQKPNFTDIIIPSYNNEHLTVACFESIKECTAPGTYRIIWVDNGSKDFKKAEDALKGVDHISIMLPTNTGFVGAVNAGWSKSDAPTLCLLNNDTEVSPGWMDKLTNILYSDPKIGIVGPLTGPPAIKQQYDSHHNIAYQQLHREVPVFPYYRNLNDFNKKIEAMQPRLVGDISFVAFLCAVLKREVIDAVTDFHPSYKNGLDDKYEMGMWDDCDYNWAIEKVGYRKAIALDTCIVHKGRSTFKVIQEKEKFDVDKLLKKNRKYMDKKQATIEKELLKCE